MSNIIQHTEGETRLKLDALTKILRVNGAWIEDLEFCERLKVHALLFRGCEERADIESELAEAEENIAWLLSVVEEKDRNTLIMSWLFVGLSALLILLGVFIW